MNIRITNSALALAALLFASRVLAADAPPAEEKTIPSVLQRAIDEKEKQVTAARKEAIRLIEDYLHDSPESKEQAEALYKLAELYWEDSKAIYLEKMGRYQAAVTACHDNRE